MVELRVIDQGCLLTVAKVTFDPLGYPVTMELDILQAVTLEELRKIVIQIGLALDKPVLGEDKLV